MANSVTNSFFPSQVVSDQEKVSQDYGLRVGRAIQNEWFSSNSGVTRFRSNQNSFHKFSTYHFVASSNPAPTEKTGLYPNSFFALDISANECITSPARKSRYVGLLFLTSSRNDTTRSLICSNSSFRLVRSP